MFVNKKSTSSKCRFFKNFICSLLTQASGEQCCRDGILSDASGVVAQEALPELGTYCRDRHASSSLKQWHVVHSNKN